MYVCVYVCVCVFYSLCTASVLSRYARNLTCDILIASRWLCGGGVGGKRLLLETTGSLSVRCLYATANQWPLADI